MKALKILGVIIVPFLIMFMVAVFWECNLTYYYDFRGFPTYDDAGGFAPRFTPPSATDIRYIQGNESPDMWLFFNFDIEETPVIQKYCGMPVHGEIKLAPKPPGHFIDWPAEITGYVLVNAEDIAGYEFYRCTSPTKNVRPLRRILAIDIGMGKAYYWVGY